MKTLITLKQEVERVRKLASAISMAKNDLAREIENLTGEGRSKEWTESAIGSARQKALDRVHPLLSQLQEANGIINLLSSFWSDREAVLSSIPLTKRDASNLTADNDFTESMTRMAKIQEAQLMSNKRLQRSAQYALDKNNVGEMFIYAMVGNSRNPSAKIDTSGVDVPEQIEAKRVISEAVTVASNATLDFREIGGARRDTLLTDRLAAAHRAG